MNFRLSPQERWERGIPHHPKAVKLFQFIRIYDDQMNSGSFDWECGGDGDNGEQLLYALDEWFEQQDEMKDTL